jgi:hypothetical protein
LLQHAVGSLGPVTLRVAFIKYPISAVFGVDRAVSCTI